MNDGKQKPTKDDLDLIAAALGLKSSAWAQSVVHITKPVFNLSINGELVSVDAEDDYPDADSPDEETQP